MGYRNNCAKTEIIKIIESLSGKYSAYEVFSDWVKCAAISMCNALDMAQGKVWKKREEEYLATIRKYNNKEVTYLCKMTGLLTEALEEDLTDVLGQLFMEMKLGSSQTGQFFTPFHISELNAVLALQEIISSYNGEKIKLSEPSCGGGGAIIAVAKYLKKNGIDYQKKMEVVAQDLDWKGVYMCYLQLGLLGINAVVVQGDTLAEPYHEHYQRDRIMLTPARMGVLI